jgi:uncharacterized protein YfaQ (DUF2300 family)
MRVPQSYEDVPAAQEDHQAMTKLWDEQLDSAEQSEQPKQTHPHSSKEGVCCLEGGK